MGTLGWRCKVVQMVALVDPLGKAWRLGSATLLMIPKCSSQRVHRLLGPEVDR